MFKRSESFKERIVLRPASLPDYPLIERWLKQAEVQRWWGSLAAAQSSVMAALRKPMGLCSIIIVNGEPAGYAQAQDAPAGLPSLPADLTAGCFRVEAFIGEPRFRAIGAGRIALRLVAEEVFSTTLALGLYVVVPLSNEAAVRAHEKAGFKWIRVIDDPLFGPSWLMRMERPQPSPTAAI